MGLIVGLTGGICSGKSTVATLFERKGITVIDADFVAREVVSPQTLTWVEIVEHFGPTILNADGSLNRRQLRQIIFDNPFERVWLEALLHPLIREKMVAQAKQATSEYTILMIPLLIETLPHPAVQRILVVDTPEAVQVQRTMERDQLSPEDVRKIILSQAPRDKRLQHADDILMNDKGLQALEEDVERLHQTYLTLARLK